MDSKKARKHLIEAASVLLAVALFLAGGRLAGKNTKKPIKKEQTTYAVSYSLDLAEIPEYSGKPYVVINGNEPEFTQKDYSSKSYEKYSKLDKLGRCKSCIACIGTDLMPTGERDSISAIKPTGWQTTKYSFIDGENLYNRCHLIAYQLTGESANRNNLITGTRYLNATAMLPFEEEVGNYVRATDNHVLYRVTPIFNDKELVARGVHMEAISIEDGGQDICFNVYCYNVQPGVEIDYATGKNRLKDSDPNEKSETYIVNTNNMKFHKPSCESVNSISENNKKTFRGKRSELINGGYVPCGACKP